MHLEIQEAVIVYKYGLYPAVFRASINQQSHSSIRITNLKNYSNSNYNRLSQSPAPSAAKMKFQTGLAVAALLAPSALAAPALEARACVGPDVNKASVDLIKSFEGFVASPEPDPIGLPTVGYGHLCQKKNCAEVKYKFPLTEESAIKLLRDDLVVSTEASLAP